MITFNEHVANSARKQAQKSRCRFRCGSVVSRRGTVVGRGYNDNSTHPLSNTKYRTIHAEFAAIIRCNSKDVDSIYVCRIGLGGEYRIAKPCLSCMEIINKTPIKHIWYTGRDGEWNYLKNER